MGVIVWVRHADVTRRLSIDCESAYTQSSASTCHVFLRVKNLSRLKSFHRCCDDVIFRTTCFQTFCLVHPDHVYSFAKLLLDYLREALLWAETKTRVFRQMVTAVEWTHVMKSLLAGRLEREQYLECLLDVATACYIAAIKNYDVIEGVKTTASSITQTAAANTATLGIESAAQVLGNAVAGAAISGAVDVVVSSASIYWAKRKKDKGEISEKEFNVKIKKTVCESSVKFVAGTTGSIIGQALIPVPIVGAFVGGVCGSLIGSGIGKGINYGIFDRNKNQQEAEEKPQNEIRTGTRRQFRGYVPKIIVYNETENRFETKKFERKKFQLKGELAIGIKSKAPKFNERDARPFLSSWKKKTQVARSDKPNEDSTKESIDSQQEPLALFRSFSSRLKNRMSIKTSELDAYNKLEVNVITNNDEEQVDLHESRIDPAEKNSKPSSDKKEKAQSSKLADTVIQLMESREKEKKKVLGRKEGIVNGINIKEEKNPGCKLVDEKSSQINKKCRSKKDEKKTTNECSASKDEKKNKSKESNNLNRDISAKKQQKYLSDLCDSLNDESVTEAEMASLTHKYLESEETDPAEESPENQNKDDVSVGRKALAYLQRTANLKNVFKSNNESTYEETSKRPPLRKAASFEDQDDAASPIVGRFVQFFSRKDLASFEKHAADSKSDDGKIFGKLRTASFTPTSRPFKAADGIKNRFRNSFTSREKAKSFRGEKESCDTNSLRQGEKG